MIAQWVAGLRLNTRSGVNCWRDYYQLTKPKVVMLLLLTALVGMCLASENMLPFSLFVVALTGIGMLASAAAVINHVVDRGIDGRMARTQNRPVVSGKVSPAQAYMFSAVLAVIGFALLYFWVNALTAWLTLTSLMIYAFIYTLFLKRATPQNIVIGGLAGAAPPLLGWTAVTGQLHAHALLLVLIIFTWTPPHFWALAINRHKDYARANVPMLSVTHGIEFTKTAVLLYTLLLSLVCLLPYLVGMSGLIYLMGSSVLNAGFLYYALCLKCHDGIKYAMPTFRYSIVHLMLLFVFLLTDHYAMWSL